MRRAAPRRSLSPSPCPSLNLNPSPRGRYIPTRRIAIPWEQGELTCTLPETEGHAHSEACWQETKVLLCELPESEGHVHGDACRDETGALICGQEESEGHTHGDACWEVRRELVCQQEETPAHQHTEACYAQNKVLTCTLPTEAEAPAAEPAPEEAPQEPLPGRRGPGGAHLRQGGDRPPCAHGGVLQRSREPDLRADGDIDPPAHRRLLPDRGGGAGADLYDPGGGGRPRPRRGLL